MGCSQSNEDIHIESNSSNNRLKKSFEDYSTLEVFTYTAYYYQLIWKTRPIICFYQLKSQEKFNKREINNLNLLFKQKSINQNNNIEILNKDRLIIYYIHCNNGVIISRNTSKINFYMSNYMDNVIDICLVDISSVYLTEGEKFHIYEVKNQSKYFFNLNMKEIDFSNRNQLISMGKEEKISIEEIINEDEEFAEKNNILKNKEIIVKYSRKRHEKRREPDEKDLFFQNKIESKDRDKEKEIKDKKDKKESKDKDKINKNENENENDNTNVNVNAEASNERKIMKIRNIKAKNGDEEKAVSLNQSIGDSNTREKMSDSELLNKKFKKKEIKELKKTKFYKSQYNIKGNKYNLNQEKEFMPESRNNIKFIENSPNKEDKTSIFEDSLNINNSILKFEKRRSINAPSLKQTFLNFNGQQKNYDNKDNLNAYEIKDNCLIIKQNKFCPEVNRELEELFFEGTTEEDKISKDGYSPYDHIDYAPPFERKKIRKGTKTRYQNIKEANINSINSEFLSNIDKENNANLKEKNLYNYIKIHNRFKVPFELRTNKNIINKIILTVNDFETDSPFYFKEFIDMITNYKHLKQIKILQNQNLSSNFCGWKYLKKLFLENFNIRWVSLKNGEINDKVADIIISSMIMKRIRYLNISNNKITNKAMYYLNKFLIKNQTLSVLYMSKNKNLNMEGIRLITNALQMHPNIIKLDISHMNLSGGGQFILKLLNENKCLQDLNLRNTNLTKNDISCLVSTLTNEDSHLISIDLGLNSNIGDEGLREIGKIINNNRSLKSLGLDGLNLSMNNYLPIFEGIFKNRNIESYSLNMNWKLPLKGILNFFLKNPNVKEISITPWDIQTEADKKFSKEQLYALQKFHLKAPNVIIKGITFVECEENENGINEDLNENK